MALLACRVLIFLAAICFALAGAGCGKEPVYESPQSTPGPPALTAPEMPGDRYWRMVHWQEKDLYRFANHYFILDFENVTPIEAIEKIFRAAAAHPPYYYRKKGIPIPELIFEDDLASIEKWKVLNSSFGQKQSGSPRNTIAVMLANICLDHDIALREVSPKRYVFGLADPHEPQDHQVIENGRKAGLELHVEFIDGLQQKLTASITNHGTETVRLGKPTGRWFSPSLAVWSVFPGTDTHSQRPSPRCHDRFTPGCGTGPYMWFNGILEIEPGETVSLGYLEADIWELRSGYFEGEFRAALYFRNDPNNPRVAGWLNDDDPDEMVRKYNRDSAEQLKGTLDCLLISNEIVVPARKRRTPQ